MHCSEGLHRITGRCRMAAVLPAAERLRRPEVAQGKSCSTRACRATLTTAGRHRLPARRRSRDCQVVPRPAAPELPSDVRGAQRDDMEGHRMRPMARSSTTRVATSRPSRSTSRACRSCPGGDDDRGRPGRGRDHVHYVRSASPATAPATARAWSRSARRASPRQTDWYLYLQPRVPQRHAWHPGHLRRADAGHGADPRRQHGP